MATHSSILAWKTPRTEELEVYSPWGHKESDTTERLTLNNNTPLEKEMATHSRFLPGKSHGQQNLVDYSPWSRKRDRYDLATKQQNACYLKTWFCTSSLPQRIFFSFRDPVRTGILMSL